MRGKTVVLGVSGGIAAYKVADLASKLTQAGAIVRVVMTEGAQRFISPLTFQALTHQPVGTSLWADPANAEVGSYAAMPHIGLADTADVVLIAPASADCIARLAGGISDDLLTTICLATRAPILVAPAMNPQMLSHPATQRNLALLQSYGYQLLDPETGRMACEHVGSGRLPTTEVLMNALNEVLTTHSEHVASQNTERSSAQPLAEPLLRGRLVVVTAGGTREPLDPVRYVGNRSSGKMGYALAEAAAERGARVVLVSGPTSLPTPQGVTLVRVETTQEMQDAVVARSEACDVLIAAAAPADFRPRVVAASKIKKSESSAEAVLQIELVENPDVVATFARGKRPDQVAIGFAAETGDPTAEAQRKLAIKHLDAVVGNDVSASDAGFETDTNRVVWVTAQEVEPWPLLSKRDVANRICDRVAALLSGRKA